MDEGQWHFEEAFIGSEFNFVGTEGSLHHSKPLTITQSPFFHKLPAAVSFVKKKVRVEYQNVKVKVLNVRVQNVKATVNL